MENFGTFTILACDEQKKVHEDKVRRAIRRIRKEK